MYFNIVDVLFKQNKYNSQKCIQCAIFSQLLAKKVFKSFTVFFFYCIYF